MVLKFNSLVLIPSDQCNAFCKHCAPECGPRSKRSWDVAFFKKCIMEASKIPNLEKHVHFAGGEPFLYYHEMLELAHIALEYGFTISIVTNGFWGSDQKKAEDYIERLVDTGLCRVELSTDSFHREYVPLKTVKKALRVLKAAGVCTVLRVVTTRRHMVDEAIRDFSAEDLDGLEIVGSPIVPVGRALQAVPEEEYYLSKSGAIGACSTLLNLTVRWDGNVSPCCAGSELNRNLSLGNINNAPLDLIVRNAEWNAFVKKLVYQGPSSFFTMLQEEKLASKIDSQYTNVCHACTKLLGDPEVASVLKARILTLQQQSMVILLEGLN